MTISEAELAQYVERTEKRISALEEDLRRVTKNEGRWANTNMFHPVTTNLSNIREMFLLEIIREAGLLERVDLEAITAKVREQLVDAKNIPRANADRPGKENEAQKIAESNLEEVLHELAGIYAVTDDSLDK